MSTQTIEPTEELEQSFRFEDTTATKRVFKLKKRIRAVAGGTSASKTISIMVWLIDYCQSKKNKLVHVVSESYPHLEAGPMLDLMNILKAQGYWEEARWHGTKHYYTFETGSVLRFYSVDLSSAHGPRRDVLFINEANNIPAAVFDQLEPRTREIIWLDWNPSEEFWFYKDVLVNRADDVDFITLTYKDNDALDDETVKAIESRKGNKMWWQVYGLGQLGEIEGRIYTGWRVIDEIPFEAKLMRRGLDFGYSNDPAAIVDVYYLDGGYILDERLYARRQDNEMLASFVKNLENPNTIIIADSSEPKSIAEMHKYGAPSVTEAWKGQGSRNTGIQWVQNQRISVTSRSLNLLEEYRGYMWKYNKDGEQLKEPEDGNDHLLDALRYAMESLEPRRSGVKAYKPESMLKRKRANVG